MSREAARSGAYGTRERVRDGPEPDGPSDARKGLRRSNAYTSPPARLRRGRWFLAVYRTAARFLMR
ncbi:hypothetical protein GCM10010387_02800 [Streptomyces inusitatus]|uniref:Uncharacterized protein n=1 Tax=Streptomyces inusitatus TaxID=68221 RepID=A0A918PKE0_9ACTN|nr:hypothetical protein GCM10010387_02800 [Streptomyces inusitatus]